MDTRQTKKMRISVILVVFALILILSYGIFTLNDRLSLRIAGGDRNDQIETIKTKPLSSINQTRTSYALNQTLSYSRIEVSVDDDPVKGSNDASVIIVEFSDFQCVFCAKFSNQTLPLIEEKYIKTGKVKFVYRDIPIIRHVFAQKAAEASEFANDQGKFWEYHDILFQRQAEWSKEGIPKLKEYARSIGLDAQKFDESLDSGKYADEVQKDFRDGLTYGVSTTPTFFINGIKVEGAQPFSVFEQIIEQELKR